MIDGGFLLVWGMYLTLIITMLLSPFAFADVLNIKYGVNSMDINGDGIDDMIIRTRWDVSSAHSADKYSLAVSYGGNGAFIPKGYYDVGFQEDNSRILWTSEGADCVLSGYVFHVNKGKALEIDYYHRDWGEGYADTQPVTITRYRLTDRHNEALEGMGLTPYFLKKIKERRIMKKYCDVRPLMK